MTKKLRVLGPYGPEDFHSPHAGLSKMGTGPGVRKRTDEMVEILIELNTRLQKHEDALKNIFANTIHQKPNVYTSGILANIEMAVGKDKYDEWENYYK